jgi:capsular exopolysaccharide synthesis family protein
LSVIEPAPLPAQPIGPNKLVTVLLAASVGLLLSVGAAYLIEYLDDTVRTSDDVERVTHAPILGYLFEMDGQERERLYVAENPRNPITEAYRTLRTNLEFANVDKSLKTIFIASADSEDGKSSVAANLAVVMAQGEKRVMVLDADMRKPNLHAFFGLSNEYGLSDVFRGRISLEDAIKEWRGGQIKVITAGTPPPNPTDLLGSRKMTEILETLAGMADVVVIDGPPFVVADAAVLAARVDGVLMVIRAGQTREATLKVMVDQIARSGARVIGVALNRIPRKSAPYFGGHPYYSYYNEAYGAEPDDTKPLPEKPAGWLQRLTSKPSDNQ